MLDNIDLDVASISTHEQACLPRENEEAAATKKQRGQECVAGIIQRREASEAKAEKRRLIQSLDSLQVPPPALTSENPPAKAPQAQYTWGDWFFFQVLRADKHPVLTLVVYCASVGLMATGAGLLFSSFFSVISYLLVFSASGGCLIFSWYTASNRQLIIEQAAFSRESSLLKAYQQESLAGTLESQLWNSWQRVNPSLRVVTTRTPDRRAVAVTLMQNTQPLKTQTFKGNDVQVLMDATEYQAELQDQANRENQEAWHTFRDELLRVFEEQTSARELHTLLTENTDLSPPGTGVRTG
jgi:hypothetical protein